VEAGAEGPPERGLLFHDKLLGPGISINTPSMAEDGRSMVEDGQLRWRERLSPCGEDLPPLVP